jgi:hypothetical protein
MFYSEYFITPWLPVIIAYNLVTTAKINYLEVSNLIKTTLINLRKYDPEIICKSDCEELHRKIIMTVTRWRYINVKFLERFISDAFSKIPKER